MHGIKKATKKSLESYGWAILAIGLIYTFIAIAIHFFTPKQILQQTFWGLDMNFWITFGIPAALFLVFLAIGIACAPYEIYKEQFEKHSEDSQKLSAQITQLESKIEAFFNQRAPLLIQCRAAEMRNNTQNNCEIILTNPNSTQGLDGVELILRDITPPIARHDHPSDSTGSLSTLAGIKFEALDMQNGVLKGQMTATIPVFTVFEQHDLKFFRFYGTLQGVDEGLWRVFNTFLPEWGTDYIFTFEATANGIFKAVKRFKLGIAVIGQTPQCTFEEIT